MSFCQNSFLETSKLICNAKTHQALRECARRVTPEPHFIYLALCGLFNVKTCMNLLTTLEVSNLNLLYLFFSDL